MACDTLGRPVRFLLAPGNSHDILAVPTLLEGHKKVLDVYGKWPSFHDAEVV